MANTIGIDDYNWIIAYTYMDLKEYASAIPHWDKAIESWPSRDDWIEEKFKCLSLTNKKGAATFYNSYAKSLMENKQYFKALQCLDKVLEIDSYDAEAISQKQNCIKNERYNCLYNILNAVSKMDYSTSRESDEDLKEFIEDISKKSRMSIEDIFNYCYFSEIEDYDFKDILSEYISSDELIRLHEICGWNPYGISFEDEEDEEDDNDNSAEENDEWKKLSEELSKIKSLDEMEDEYWNLVKEKNSYDVLNEIDITKNNEEKNDNKLTSCENEITIMEFDEENNNNLTNTDEDELINNFDEENNNINYLSKIKEAKDLLDNGTITREEYDELKLKYLSLI